MCFFSFITIPTSLCLLLYWFFKSGPSKGLMIFLPTNGPFCNSDACLKSYLLFEGYDYLSTTRSIGI